jgi:selenocysteine lyase/cysteine desulfurase
MTRDDPAHADEASLRQWRADTPGCASRIHLNNAGAALMPRSVSVAVADHLELERDTGGYEAAHQGTDAVAAAYGNLATLVGAHARNIAIVENATVAVAQALSVFDWSPGDTIVTTSADYASNQIMYLSLAKRRGVRVVRAPDLAEGGVDPEALRAALRATSARLVSISWVPTNSGLVQAVPEVAAICGEAGVPLLVDACQAVGQIPTDLGRLRCDFLAATARKFLRGPRGIGFLYVSDEALSRGWHPLYVDMHGAEWITPDEFRLASDARRFENWEFAYTLILGLGEAARYALEVGVGRAGARAVALAGRVRTRLARIPGVRVRDRGRDLCAIVTASVDGRAVKDLVGRLRARGINVHESTRDDEVIDMDGKRVSSLLRVSPHYYNTVEEVDGFAEALSSILDD